MSILNFYFNLIAHQVGKLGLPVDKYLVTYALIALFVYCVGYLSKRIAGVDD